MSCFPRTSLLSKQQRRLLLLMRDIRYGRIDSLSIKEGSPVIDESTRVVRYVRLSDRSSNTETAQRSNLLDKPQVKEFLGLLSDLGEGLLESIEIQDGLPFRMNVVERINPQG